MSANTIQFRNSERLRISLPVQVLVNDSSDEPLDCETLLINLNGCGLRTTVSVPVGTKVRIRNDKDEIPGRVVTCIQAAGSNSFSVGVKFDQPYFWPIPNPPTDWATGAAPKPSQAMPSKAGKSKPTSPTSVSAGAPDTNDSPSAPVARADPAAISQSQEVIKQLNEAITRAMTIARKLDAVAQLLPEQLESRLKQKAEEAAEAAQAAAVAGMQDRIDKHVQERASSIQAGRIEQYTADLHEKLKDADQVRKSLKQAESLLDQLHRESEEFRENMHRESEEFRENMQEFRENIQRESTEVGENIQRESAEFRENLASESRKAVDELLSSAASLQVAAVDMEQQTIESVRQQIQLALDESLAKLEQHVKAASQRFASALHAAASHASQPPEPDDSDEVGVAMPDQANRAGMHGEKKRRS